MIKLKNGFLRGLAKAMVASHCEMNLQTAVIGNKGEAIGAR